MLAITAATAALLLAQPHGAAAQASSGLTADTACNKYFCLNAIYDASQGRVNYTMYTQSGVQPTGWYAMGTGNRMAGSDMMISWVSSQGAPIMSQRTTTAGHAPPTTQITAQAASTIPKDTYSNSSLTSWSWSSPVSSSSFTPSNKTSYIWAANPSNNPGDSSSSSLRQHSDFGTLSLNLDKAYTPSSSQSAASSSSSAGSSSGAAMSSSTSGGGSSSTRLIVVHLVFMILAWLVVSPLAVLIGRWGRTTLKAWYPYHQYLQLFTIAFTVIGFSVIVSKVQSDFGGDHFSDTHGKVGLAVFILAICQAALGAVGHTTKRFHPTRIVHVVVGLTTSILAIYNLGTGFEKYSYNTAAASKYIVWGIGFGGFGLAYVAGLTMLPRDLRQWKEQSNGSPQGVHTLLPEKLNTR
ncbi:hypothetical protein ACQY0O_003378 [Thecaphora frezii]